MEPTPAPTITLSESELCALIDHRIEEHERERHRSHVGKLEHGTIVELVKSLTPDEDLGYGKRYLLALLEAKGKYGLERFLDKALEAVDEEGKLDISRNFDSDERKLFEQLFLGGKSSNVVPQSITRRQFISKAGRVASAAFVVEALVLPTADIMGIDRDTVEQGTLRRGIQFARNATEWVIAPTGLIAIGAHVNNDEDVESARIRLENITKKLSHIEWAIDELAKASKKHQGLNGYAEKYASRNAHEASPQR